MWDVDTLDFLKNISDTTLRKIIKASIRHIRLYDIYADYNTAHLPIEVSRARVSETKSTNRGENGLARREYYYIIPK